MQAIKVLLPNLCGHGHFDLSACDQYLTEKMGSDLPSPTKLDWELVSVPGNNS